MNWQKISIERLKSYENRQQALSNIPEQIETLEMSLTAIRAAKTDKEPIKEGGNKREDAIINNIVMREELSRNLEIAKREVEITENAMKQLTRDEQKILYRFYVNRMRGHVETLSEELCIERSRVYELKENALKKFTIACYGIVEL
jgi:hypothetical protein